MNRQGCSSSRLGGVKVGFWSHLGCSVHSTNILSCRETELREEKQKSYFLFGLFFFSYLCVLKQSLLRLVYTSDGSGVVSGVGIGVGIGRNF